ncbi:C25 family cysteine peptidase, partial [Thiolapillus sp.]
MSSAVTAGNDVNTFGLRMRSGNGNTDYNVFYYFNITGSLRSVNPRTVVNYPYITSGCGLGSNDFDFDVPGGGNGSSMDITSRLGTSTAINPLSAPSAWNTQSIVVEGRDDSAEDYGVGTLTLNPRHSGAGNVASWYLNTEGSGTLAPSSRFTLNNTSAHRIYFPTGTGNNPGGPPTKPYLAQWVRQNDPAGNSNEFTITIRLINPTDFDITAAIVDGLIPSPVTYGGVRSGFPTHGSVTSQPGVGSSGALSWEPGTVAAGETAVLAYNITVPDPNVVTTVTGTSSTINSTRASFNDETGTPFATGGLCELRIGPALTQALVTDFRGAAVSDGVLLQWNTASEVGTLGFYVERENPATGDWLRLNDGKLVPGLGLSDPQGGAYTFLDVDAKPGETQRYRLIELDGKGNQRLYGPYVAALDEVPDAQVVHAASLSAAPYTVTARKPAPASETQQTGKGRMMAVAAASNGQPDGMRIGIRETGLYFLGAAQIAATLNLPEAEVINHISQQHLSLSNRGNEMAWLPADSDTGLYFYAEAIDSIYTRDNVVLLTVAQGMRVAVEDGGNPSPLATPLEVPFEQHFEQDLIPAFSRAVEDYWYWGAVGNYGGYEQADFGFEFHAVAEGVAELSLNLEGYSHTSHVVKVELNGTDLGNLSWDGQLSYKAGLVVPDGLLVDGNNTLTLIHQSVPDGASTVYFNSFDIKYASKLKAQNGSLDFDAQEQPVATVTGLASNAVRVLRIDSSLQPVLLENTAISAVGAGYEVSFETGEDEEGRFLVVENTAIKSPVWLSGYTQTHLATPANQADYLVIAPVELESGAEALAAYRAADGLITKVVTLDEIYLAFNQGIEDPTAIQRFMDYARDHWLVAPRYLALAGDSSYDHRHILTNIRDDHKVPAVFVGTPDGLFAADNLYGAMRDGAPRVAVGRIPVRDNAALLEYVDKLQAWESALTSDKTVQLVADNADPGAGDFPVDSNSLKPEVPPALLAATDVYLNPADSAQAHDDLLAALNEGRGLVNYLGHGGMDRLAEEGILTTADVA